MRKSPREKSEKTSVETTATSGTANVVSPAAVAAATAVAAAAAKKKTSQPQQRKKKEVIDYSAAQAEKNETSAAASAAVANSSVPSGVVIAGTVGGADPKSKVRSWLLASHCRVDAPVASALPKSKSSPMNLQANPVAGLPPRPPAAVNRTNNTRQVALRRLTGSKSRSVGNLARNETGGVGAAATAKNERVRLQVVYKPPFKFTVKLRKADKVGQVPQAGGPRNNLGPRTGVLVRTIADKKACKERKRKSKPSRASSKLSQASCIAEPANSDLHTVPSDLEVLLSESEFLFSDT